MYVGGLLCMWLLCMDRRGQPPKAGLTGTRDHQLEMAGETWIEKSQTKVGG